MGDYKFIADNPISKYHKSDFFLVTIILILWGIGLFTLFFSTQEFAERFFGNSFTIVKRQFICSLVGILGFFFFWLSKMNFLKRIMPVIVIAVVVLCILTFIPGISIEKNGARRWIKLPFGFSLQSSEFVKFAIVLFLANLFDKQKKIENIEDKNVMPAVGGMLLFVILVFFQKDFSTSAFIFAVCLLMFIVSGMKIMWILPLSVIIIPCIVLAILTEPYRLERIMGYLNPELGQWDINFQSNRAKMAISAGGIWGQGIGTGITQSTRIPEVHADYIFASWAEAMGFIGVLIYFVLLISFAVRGIKASFENSDYFASYACFGFVSMIVLQSILNCGVVCGILPSTGIPLPFFSSGGSSIIVTFCMCGFILNASRNNNSVEEPIPVDSKVFLSDVDF